MLPLPLPFHNLAPTKDIRIPPHKTLILRHREFPLLLFAPQSCMVASESGATGAEVNHIVCGVGFVEVECGGEERIFSEGLVNVFEKVVDDVEIVATCRQIMTRSLGGTYS